MTVVALIVAGALGAVSRFVVDGEVRRWVPATFPWATLLINISGSALLGFVAGLVMFHAAPTAVVAVVGTGFCGGYTTFSTASLETLLLARERRAVASVGYALSTLVLSVLACAAGLAVAGV